MYCWPTCMKPHSGYNCCPAGTHPIQQKESLHQSLISCHASVLPHNVTVKGGSALLDPAAADPLASPHMTARPLMPRATVLLRHQLYSFPVTL